MVKIKYVNNPKFLESKLKEPNKILVLDKNSKEIKQEVLRGYTAEFEMIGKLSIGNHARETRIGFTNITEFEHYINSIDDGFDAEDAIFIGYIFKINTPQINWVIRSQ